MNPTDLHDDELADRLRSTLHSRATTVAGPPPPLADLAASPDLDLAPAPTGPGRHVARWVAAAAAVVVLGGAVAYAARPDRDRPEPRSTVDTTALSTIPVDAAPSPVFDLPPSVRLATATPLFIGEGIDARAAHDVARAYLADRLGDGVPEVEERLRANIVLEARPSSGDPTTPITVLRWFQDEPGPEPKEHLAQGTLYLRNDRGRWLVVAAVSDGLSLKAVQRLPGVVSGRVVQDGEGEPGLDVVTTEGTSLFANRTTNPAQLPVQGNQPFEVAVPDDQTVVVRAMVVGGRTLGITEAALDRISVKDVLWTPGPGYSVQPGSAVPNFLSWVAGRSGGHGTTHFDASDPSSVTQDWTFHDSIRVEVDARLTASGWVITDVRDPANPDGATSGSARSTADGKTQMITLVVPDSTTSVDALVDVGGSWERRKISDVVPSHGADGTQGPAPDGFGRVRLDFDPPTEIRSVILVGRDRDGKLTTLFSTHWS